MMVSAGTLHVVSTELTVGAFAMAGLAFCSLDSPVTAYSDCNVISTSWHHVAHFALAFGLLAMPMAVLTGIQASPGEGIDHPLLINKMLLASASFGLAFGVLLSRRTHGVTLWDDTLGSRWQAMGGMAASGLILATASIGGTFSRGESLLDMFHLPYEQVPIFPIWLSGIIVVMALANLAMMRRSNA